MSGSINVPLSQTASLMRQAQENFLRNGGIFQNVLTKMRTDGHLPPAYDSSMFQEYPKMVYIRSGVEEVTRQTEDVKGKILTWVEEVPIITKVTVNSEEEEERVLNGGKTAGQIEEERQALFATAKARGIRFDPSWSLLRLQREMGIAKPEEAAGPYDELAELQKQVARAEEALALRRKLAELQRELSAPEGPPPVAADDVEQMRQQLRDLGVKVDGRWNPLRLRQELEAATAPREVV